MAGRSGRAPAWPGLVAVAATFAFFLLWAQFGFLTVLRGRLDAAGVQAAMAAMGVAGLAASLGTARLLGRVAPRHLVALGLAAAAAVAPLGLAAEGLPALAAVAAAVGAVTALLTVSLAAGLAELVPVRRFGLAVGGAVGAGYLACNVPALFAGAPALQAAFVAASCLVALAGLVGGHAGAAPPRPATRRAVELPARVAARAGLAAVTVALFLLVWFDSAAFAVIQADAALAGATWGAGGRTLAQGAIHFAAALAAGAALDGLGGRALALLPALAMALFAASHGALAGGPAAGFAGPLYAAAVSLYSVPLVVYPAGAAGPGGVPARWRAATVFGVAGWVGSALGVGMAQDLHRVPGGFVALAAAGVGLAAWAIARRSRSPQAPSASPFARSPRSRPALALPIWLPPVAIAALTLTGLSATPEPAGLPPEGAAARIARGRAVYVAEGCIHCHSQYVRPGTRDEVLWGPARPADGPPLDRGVRPVLIGNRRQGPDLANAGSRRSAAWQRLHLADPRALVPGSPMPSYAHLFRGDGRRGEDLVAYLASLGEHTGEERARTTAAAAVPATTDLADAGRGRRLFADLCAPCHGAAGRGDGPLVAWVYRPAMDLGKGPYWAISWGEGAGETLEAGLARAIRFGIPGTSMPGHEWLDDGEVADLVAWVETLRRSAPPPAEAR